MIDSALEILYVYILGVINQQAIGYAADVACLYVCVHLLYIWVGGSGRYMYVCGTRKSARSLYSFLYLFKFNIPHKRLSALNFSVKDINFHQREKKIS